MHHLEDFFMENSRALVMSIKDERFETSCEVRDDIENKLHQIYNLLIRKNLTKVEPDILREVLINRKNEYIRSWEEILEVPNERRITF